MGFQNIRAIINTSLSISIIEIHFNEIFLEGKTKNKDN